MFFMRKDGGGFIDNFLTAGRQPHFTGEWEGNPQSPFRADFLHQPFCFEVTCGEITARRGSERLKVVQGLRFLDPRLVDDELDRILTSIRFE
jgi:hypothetical protein